MDDYLEKTCMNLGIKLVYTNNKIIFLSAEVKNGVPTLRANKIFKRCPYTVAQAVIEYYTGPENKSRYESIILGYLNQQFLSREFKIKPYNLNLKNEIISNLPLDLTFDTNDSTLVEFDITNIVIKDFWGEEKNNEYQSPFTPSNDDVLELNIVVKPPVT